MTFYSRFPFDFKILICEHSVPLGIPSAMACVTYLCTLQLKVEININLSDALSDIHFFFADLNYVMTTGIQETILHTVFNKKKR